jgi:hypothetical protein
MVPRILQSEGEVVHGAAANGDEVDSHAEKFKSFHTMSEPRSKDLPTFAP